ncbi:MAG TPA: protein kinase [Pyrinomonadaceae bacterium]|nr:protein kinase [Pyrinomonadaceae bacterium]
MKEIFEAALGHAPEERSAFVGQACGGDESLRSEVKSLLSSYEQESQFMETPAAALAAQSLVKEESAALVGQQLGHYQIVREIGRGGMGVVYLAQDITLGRPVALKLLPKHLTSDPNRLRRFEREARAASALNHHNILTIYEIAQLDGLHSIATEFIDGVTLRERIKKKDLALSETLNIAEQIASALVAAHEAGIVHRDIKPENVMLRRDGYVKVLDFGLAKLTEQQTVKRVNASAAVAGTNADTGIMGTVGYMSPEQARGESVDHRTDIFSLGVVIYEMMTGHMPFEARNAAGAIVPIAEEEPPPLAHYSPEAPAELQLIVNKALRQNRDERYQTATELLADLKSVTAKHSAKSRFTARRLSLLAATLAVAVGGLFWFYASSRTVKSSLPPMKVVPFTSVEGNEFSPAFSPDGNQIAFAWGKTEKGGHMNFDIYVKQIRGGKDLQITSDPADEMEPVWSPDGQKIAFTRLSESEVAIFTVPSISGAEHKLLSFGPKTKWNQKAGGLSWSPDGKFIAYSSKVSAGQPYQISLIATDSLEKRTLTSPPAQSTGDDLGVFSPDGRTLAFERISNDGVSADIYLQPLSGGEPKRLTFDNVIPRGLAWTADGREIVFSSKRAGPDSLWRISASGGASERLALGGDNALYPSVSIQGHRLAYVTMKGSIDENIYRIALLGSSNRWSSPTKFISSTQRDTNSQFSPDGKRIAFESSRAGNYEIWVSDSDGSNPVQMTFSDRELTGTPRWSPDSRQIAFDSDREHNWDIYITSVDGGLPRRLTTASSDENVPSWSRDGRWIYFSSDRTGKREIWKAPADGGEAVQVTKQGGFLAFESVDGKFVYYTKDFRDGGQFSPGIWRTPVEGGEETLVLDSFNAENWGDWALVEDGIYFIDSDAKGDWTLRFFDFAKRSATQIAALGQDIFTNGLAVSPDRRQILYTRVDLTGGVDIMLVENFR